MRLRNDEFAELRKKLDREALIKYLIVHQMSLSMLAQRFGVSIAFIQGQLKRMNFNLSEERAKYYHNHYHKIKESGSGIKVKNHKQKRPFALYH